MLNVLEKETFDLLFYEVLNQLDCIFSIFNGVFWRMSNKFDILDFSATITV